MAAWLLMEAAWDKNAAGSVTPSERLRSWDASCSRACCWVSMEDTASWYSSSHVVAGSAVQAGSAQVLLPSTLCPARQHTSSMAASLVLAICESTTRGFRVSFACVSVYACGCVCMSVHESVCVCVSCVIKACKQRGEKKKAGWMGAFFEIIFSGRVNPLFLPWMVGGVDDGWPTKGKGKSG